MVVVEEPIKKSLWKKGAPPAEHSCRLVLTVMGINIDVLLRPELWLRYL